MKTTKLEVVDGVALVALEDWLRQAGHERAIAALRKHLPPEAYTPFDPPENGSWRIYESTRRIVCCWAGYVTGDPALIYNKRTKAWKEIEVNTALHEVRS